MQQFVVGVMQASLPALPVVEPHTQRPAVHVSLVPQATPHAPQLSSSVWVFVSQPSVASPSQLA